MPTAFGSWTCRRGVLSEPLLPDDAAATLLFPQFESGLYRIVSTEVAGLSDPQLDFESDRWNRASGASAAT